MTYPTNFMRLALVMLVAAGSFYATPTFAQMTPVKETIQGMSQGSQNCLVLSFPEMGTKEIERAWEKYVKEFGGKTRKESKTGEIFTNNAVVKKFGDNTIDIYGKVTGDKNNASLAVFFNLGGAYLNSKDHPEKYKKAYDMLTQFGVATLREEVQNTMKDEDKKLRKEEDRLKGLVKNQAELEKGIENDKNKIKKAEDDIKKSIDAQKTQTVIVEKQKGVVEEVKKKLSELK